ncbi:4-amino-4-deoxy-L-arabinose-phospho-UDP flippase [Pseudomonas syringae pv. syringae]|uniref:Probable 4-amino-4-deoxy-L-arabinose-phosphoundecaprenol flippase subunit ArnF n=3 Tax=Pseudomonas TaxID=286 RepID=ARNF_PSEU2|nr:RecName: Full=Probable 4-amino-4-deoxy-L-arabinose-phosphoundecaprenol flippase subunit ArnF; Short=L-Ara4N-phosphoundecaprenol flippase subunit ArnF; AltName: Full=Undecaprenyl phosphate-aminoarabinose flippase subunit ArnF [Pseudomonas syringae pv. syringae B728a]AVB26122.1 4-amino-4-deoxy-L-arabinose-phospho-UDP flippase [Pseudomonas syringae pv. syringae]MCF5180272.1 4-amino-4-deoxy-L-arabinose-phosphoundecaprenol flippase subunit ArnF [Pseudomonas syringae]MCW6056291.1 4-amino-4-deoxy-L-
MTHRRATLCAMASVALVSAAQLGMRWSMSRLPSPVQWLEMQEHAQLDLSALRVVCASITAYALSMLFWLLALRVLPLSRAYSLLSISYALVYTLAATLPFFHETFTVSKTVGVSLIVAGVLTINLRRLPRPSPQDLSHENQRFR